MKEFIAMMAFLMALVALSIDALLPAFAPMSAELQILRPNDIQYVVSLIFLGMALGFLVYGPVSDAIGRKRTLFLGLILFIIGSIISWASHSLEHIMIGRFVQGFGVAAPRIMAMAIVRDKYEGRDMAAVMSLVMGFFVLFPTVAPAIGQAILHIADWRAIFVLYMGLGILAITWTSFRLEETLPIQKRRPLDLRHIWSGIKEATTTRVTFGYTLCTGFAFGCMISYINIAQQVFDEIFHVGDLFPLYFALLALALCAAFFTNSQLVRRFGMRRMTSTALITVIVSSSLFLAHSLLFTPSLPVFMVCCAIAFFCLGLCYGNLNAMALEPMKHIAGLASAFLGALSVLIAMVSGSLFSQFYNGSIVPLAAAFLCLSTAAFLTMIWTEKGIPHEHPENKIKTL